jgi:hypothetical protein
MVLCLTAVSSESVPVPRSEQCQRQLLLEFADFEPDVVPAHLQQEHRVRLGGSRQAKALPRRMPKEASRASRVGHLLLLHFVSVSLLDHSRERRVPFFRAGVAYLG